MTSLRVNIDVQLGESVGLSRRGAWQTGCCGRWEAEQESMHLDAEAGLAPMTSLGVVSEVRVSLDCR